MAGARHGHCQLAIDNETFFIGGGYNSHKTAYDGDLKTGVTPILTDYKGRESVCVYQRANQLINCLPVTL